MKHALILGLLCTIGLLSVNGCRAGAKGRPLEELVRDGNKEEVYRVNPGDILDVQVWMERDLSGNVTVREDGKFTMKLINDVPAENLTLEQIKENVTELLKSYVPGASVSISLVRTSPIKYFLSGSFAKPGDFRSDGKITLLQAIATGGGFAPFADESSIVLIRRTPQGEIRYMLDYNRVIDGRVPNPELKNGDVIAVQ